MTSTAQPDDRDLVRLLERIYERSGFDFRGHARARLRRRVVDDPTWLGRLLEALAHEDTPIFADPEADRALREQVVPLLRTYPSSNVWLPSCSTGAHAYATAIVLREEGLAGRAHIYATDLSEAALASARRGIYPRAAIRAAEAGYRAGGGRSTLAEYYADAGDDGAVVRPLLRDHVTFLQHDLVSGASFNEFNLILCRDLLPELGPVLQARVFHLMSASLSRFGILGVGSRDAHRLRPPASLFEILDPRARLYRRTR